MPADEAARQAGMAEVWIADMIKKLEQLDDSLSRVSAEQGIGSPMSGGEEWLRLRRVAEALRPLLIVASTDAAAMRRALR